MEILGYLVNPANICHAQVGYIDNSSYNNRVLRITFVGGEVLSFTPTYQDDLLAAYAKVRDGILAQSKLVLRTE